MLDIIGNAEELGKAIGADAVKNTFVQLYGLEKCDALVQTHTAKAKEALRTYSNAGFMTELADALVGRIK